MRLLKHVFIWVLFISLNFLLDLNSSDYKSDPVVVYGNNHPLVNIQDVALEDSSLFVLTSREPSIHFFNGRNYKSWGDEGNGPGELTRPLAIEVNNNSVFVLDAQPNSCKIESYTFQGNHLSSMPVRNVQMCYELKISSNFKILQVGKWMQQENELILVDENPDTLFSYKEPQPVKIKTPEAPMNSYSFTPPFFEQPQWSINNRGEVIFWDGNSDSISIINIKTGEEDLFKVPPHDIAVKSSDIDEWIKKEFSSDETLFGIEDPFRSMRGDIKEKVSFPDYYPLISDIKTDPMGNLWILRASKQSGQIWSYWDSEGNKTIKFPQKREVEVIGKKYIVTTTKDEDGIEYVELYERGQLLSKD